MTISPSIFKAYDIRGIVPTTVNEDVALRLGRAFGTQALLQGEKKVSVGRDGRLSGPSLADALMRGLEEAGIEVIDVGMVTTPMLYFAANTLCTSGIQVTGSHNPRDYNGFKMVMGGRAIFGDDIQALRHMMVDATWTLKAGGNRSHADVRPAYQERIQSDIHLQRPIKIVVDSGNGVAGASAPDILRSIGCEVIELYSEVDGNFPNHHPDPSKPENLRDLIHALQTSDAELGLAFDGDGDRLGIVTRDGSNIYPDRQMILFSQDVLSRVPGGTILFDVKCSQRLAPAIKAAGGVPLMFKTGHSLITAKIDLSPFDPIIMTDTRWWWVEERSSTAATYSLGVSGSASFSNAGQIVYQASIAGNDTIGLTFGLTLDEINKYLLCSGSGSTVSFSAFGSEIS